MNVLCPTRIALKATLQPPPTQYSRAPNTRLVRILNGGKYVVWIEKGLFFK